MKKLKVILFVGSAIALSGYVSSCQSSAAITARSGAQIWGETCIRCHTTPSPSTFSDVEWDVATMHMQLRANLTPEETRKVYDFLISAN